MCSACMREAIVFGVLFVILFQLHFYSATSVEFKTDILYIIILWVSIYYSGQETKIQILEILGLSQTGDYDIDIGLL